MMDEITSIEQLQDLVVKNCKRDWSAYGDVSAKYKDNLILFNYTAAAQYNRRWNFFERISRGLILDCDTGEIVARPFDKFFNWLEDGRKSRGHIVTIAEKMDGSLGILYRHNGEYYIATRGSFDSEQAIWATEHLRKNHDLSNLKDSVTLLFEIIYPENRVVLDYGERADLTLLAIRNRHTGDYLPFFGSVYATGNFFGFALPKVYTFNDVETILAKTGEIEDEGYVVEFSDGERFKFKGDRYLELHKLIHGLSYKNTVKAFMRGELQAIRDQIPDEFLKQFNQWVNHIESAHEKLMEEISVALEDAPDTLDRKTFALWVMQVHKELSGFIFARVDGKSMDKAVERYLLDTAPAEVQE